MTTPHEPLGPAPVLNTLTIGTGPARLVFVHGLFGQGRNFGTIAKTLADQATSLLVDLPNHGRSPWTQEFDYGLFAGMLAADLEARGAREQPVVLLGHSMGGKVVMRLALDRPDLIRKLVVVDIAPANTGNPEEFQHYADAMAALDLASLTSRADADAAMRPAVPNDITRSFLLQSLHRGENGQGWHWLPNLDLLRRSMPLMSGWPDLPGAHWDGPVLWLVGELSSLLPHRHEQAMRGYFPNTRLQVIPGAGHWVHADQPRAFADALAAFIDE
ncbi:alpha/beta fold hydrolase [Brooklawnia cerclae]|uniref:Pimeloyl-ACP methyl ester carboxylesterase n=1 Tax=Brooklawnia cerclae TaxID=349934 RepID=A0ABX0SEQ6_9ACTN|nr:alpha/beta fold hydrolase [Brooklawnia cerclae]NIH56446.1 pimeloyl-ACP methyl ester carboxylesterase [Brooklawnia cerclae]